MNIDKKKGERILHPESCGMRAPDSRSPAPPDALVAAVYERMPSARSSSEAHDWPHTAAPARPPPMTTSARGIGANPPRVVHGRDPDPTPLKKLKRSDNLLELLPLSTESEHEAVKLAGLFDPNIKSEGWQERHGGVQAAGPYALGYWRAALGAAQLLKSRPQTSLEQILRVLGGERHKLAIQADSPMADQFGSYLNPRRDACRMQPICTPISDKYLRLSHVQDFVTRLQRHDISTYGTALLARRTGSECAFLFQEPMPNGRFMELSLISSFFAASKGGMAWMHASWTLETMAHTEGLFTDALKPVSPELSPDARLDHVCKRVGRLHYFLAHCCPFERGSASVSDMLTTALMYHHGYHHAGWQPNVSADVVALVTPTSTAFAEIYRELMAPGPVSFTAPL